MEIIGTGGDGENFIIYKSFDSRLFSPIGKYVNWKLENSWDDYNELYHAINYIESLKKLEGICCEIHTIEKDGDIKGVLTIVGGAIDKLGVNHGDFKKTILLKYFHIIEKGKGYGGYWLKSVIMPHYYDLGFRQMLISSSHPKSFNFYNKIGQETETYYKKSDNDLYERICKTFVVRIE
ncbi:hypothetical protein LVD15_03225 [Fulvivirga maritima]|uniref:hypothetical protein n=1 Tax=Fulvivirga maritima TaxID=2904247 RepID=UPI001F2C1829|nr:hypothetical protein [Fulvivirga maritima]UII27457.1 hypothetical protein LVD15_03225 [Fulvivirga maritima]